MYLFIIYLLFYNPENKNHTSQGKRSNIKTLRMKKLRLKELGNASKFPKPGSYSIQILTKILRLSKLVFFHLKCVLSLMHLQICGGQTLMSVYSTLALVRTESKEEHRGWDWEVNKQNKQSNRCSDRSRPSEDGNWQLTVWRISKKPPREGDAWNGFKEPMRIIQINQRTSNLKHLPSDLGFI